MKNNLCHYLLTGNQLPKGFPKGCPVQVKYASGPYVLLGLGENRPLMPFIVDTGSDFSYIARFALGLFGIEDALQPCDDEDVDGSVTFPVTQDLLSEFCFWVLPHCSLNLLATDFLTSGCCVLDLHPEFPSLWVHREPRNTDKVFEIKDRFQINGTETLALVDSGSCALATCSAEVAESLQLQVGALEQPVPIGLSDGEYVISHRANVLVKGPGTQAKGSLDIVPSRRKVFVGIPLIGSAIITFFEGGA